MSTQLILTVGTNPLPVWVAWYHLKDELPQPIKVRLVHTAGTVDESNRLKKYCHGADFLEPIQISAGNPGTVRQNIGVILEEDLDGIDNLHIHYTGGTKVMAVETVAGIEYDLPEDIGLNTSYLDPRAASGPAIVDSNGRTLVQDTRKNVTVDLLRTALLNGFTIGPFRYRYWDKQTEGHKTEECPAPGRPDREQCNEGIKVLRTRDINIDDPEISQLIEYGTYACLEEALKNISEHNPDRNNYKIFHSVYIRRAGTTDPNVKPFELDVVAVLGYQIVVVSCTGSSGHDLVKQKGMEAILRARQLGGDEAWAIVLCRAHPDTAKLIQDELRDEMGSASEPLRIWGRSMWRKLSNEFRRYLRNDLRWI